MEQKDTLQRKFNVQVDEKSILVVGGTNGDGRSARVYQYDVRKNAFGELPSMSQARDGAICGTVRTKGGDDVIEVVVAGGGASEESGKTVEIYDVAKGHWRAGKPMSTSLMNAASAPFSNAFVVLGGRRSDLSDADQVLEYDPTAEAFATVSGVSLKSPTHALVAASMKSVCECS